MCNLCLLTHWFLPLVFVRQKMFKVEQVNCICVDWRRGARTQYTQAVHNIRVVGAEIAFLVQGLSVNPCLGRIRWGRGSEGAGKLQGSSPGSLGTGGQGLGPQAWKHRGAFPKMKLQPSALPRCGRMNPFEPQFPALKPSFFAGCSGDSRVGWAFQQFSVQKMSPHPQMRESP